jgi:hypothetical protein
MDIPPGKFVINSYYEARVGYVKVFIENVYMKRY